MALRLSPQASAPSHSPGMFSKAGSAPRGHGGSGGEKETPLGWEAQAQALCPAWL